MALQSSGAISLNDIHIEAGGTTGTSASINDADIRALIGKSSGVSMSFSEWYGASASYSHDTRGVTWRSESNGGFSRVSFQENDSNHIVLSHKYDSSSGSTIGEMGVNLIDYTDGSRVKIGTTPILDGSRALATWATPDGGCLVAAPTSQYLASNGVHGSGSRILEKFNSSGVSQWKRKLHDYVQSGEYGTSAIMDGFVEGDDFYYTYYESVLSGIANQHYGKINHTNGNFSWKKSHNTTPTANTDIYAAMFNAELSNYTKLHQQNLDWSNWFLIRMSQSDATGTRVFMFNKSDGSQVTSLPSGGYANTFTTKTITAAPSGWTTSSFVDAHFGDGTNNIQITTSNEDAKLSFKYRSFLFYNGVFSGRTEADFAQDGVYVRDFDNADHWWNSLKSAYGNFATPVNNRGFFPDFAISFNVGDDANDSVPGERNSNTSYVNLLDSNRDYITLYTGAQSKGAPVSHYMGCFVVVDKSTGKGNLSISNNTETFLPSSSNKQFEYYRDTTSTSVHDGGGTSGYSFSTGTLTAWRTTSLGVSNYTGDFPTTTTSSLSSYDNTDGLTISAYDI